MQENKNPLQKTFLSQLQWRFATKSFDIDKKVSEENFNKILEAIRFAPTSTGMQPFQVIRVVDKNLREKLRGDAYNQPQVTDASELLIFCARNDLKDRINLIIDTISGGDELAKKKLGEYRDMMNSNVVGKTPQQLLDWSAEQAHIALGFALAACAELEIDSCPMGGFSRDEFHKILELPDSIYPYVILTIGYRKEGPAMPKFRLPNKDLFVTI